MTPPLSAELAASLASLADASPRADQRTSHDLAYLDAVETAARIRSGDVSAAQVVEAAIGRANRANEKLNAVAFATYERARDAALSATGPLAGVPTFIKDLDDLVQAPTGFGSRAFRGYLGAEQSPLIDAFLALGVIPLGKSTTPEFGLTATTEPLSTGPTRNPWNTDYSTGGSSGGAAALVAAGVVPIAHASDGGGSIRIPASCCGNVGLKMSRGRHPAARPELVGPIALVNHGVQTRTVRDTAAVVAALEVASDLDPIGLVIGANARRLRIGLWTKSRGRPVDPEVTASTENVGRLCESLGHVIVETERPGAGGIEKAFMLYWAKMAEVAVSLWEQATGFARNSTAFEPFTLGLAEHSRTHADEFGAAVDRLLQVPHEFEAMTADLDVVLSPVVATPPPLIGWLGADVPYDRFVERLLGFAQFTALYNIVGATAISLPLSMSKTGLPIGAMFGARAGKERMLLELAYELESASPWCGRRPKGFS